MAEALGVEPDPKLIRDIERLQKIQEGLEVRTREAGQDLFKTDPVVITRMLAPASNPDVIAEPITLQQLEDIKALSGVDQNTVMSDSLFEETDTTVERVARAISETVVSQGAPVLAQTAPDLAGKVKQLEAWISRIAATGPGSGEVNFRWLDDVDRNSINKDWYLTYDPVTKKFTFVDTRVSIEAFDRNTSIALTATPTLLRPDSFINAKNMTYDSSTGVFTFLSQCEVSLAISLNSIASASGQQVYQYAERNTGSGWVIISNSGKSFQLTNTQYTQIVNAQTISRLAGEQIRYFIYSNADKVSLITETLPNVTSGTVYVPAIRIQYAGR